MPRPDVFEQAQLGLGVLELIEASLMLLISGAIRYIRNETTSYYLKAGFCGEKNEGMRVWERRLHLGREKR